MQKPAVDNVLPQEFKLEIPEIKESAASPSRRRTVGIRKSATSQQDLVHGTRLDSSEPDTSPDSDRGIRYLFAL